MRYNLLIQTQGKIAQSETHYGVKRDYSKYWGIRFSE